MERLTKCRKCGYFSGKTCDFSVVEGVTKLKLGQKVGEPCKFFKSNKKTKTKRTGDNEKRNDEIKRLFRMGKTDSEIGDAIDCSIRRVGELRRQLGLNRLKGKRVKMEVYNTDTGDLVCEGTISECAKRLGEDEGAVEEAYLYGDRCGGYRFEVVG